MPQTPVFASANGASGLGSSPRFFGSADPNYSVEIAIANVGTVLGRGVTNPNGQWAVDLTVTPGVWYTIQARSYVTPSDPNSYSAWSSPITFAG